MTSLFCRHNRLTAKCPICSKELEAELRAKAPPRTRPARPARPSSSASPRARRTAARQPGGLVTKRLARAEDDGYRNPLLPGLRATADAERLAGALTAAAQRLEPPGPYDAVAEAPPRWADGEVPDLPGVDPRTIGAYRQWAVRAGSQEAAFTGEPDW